MRQIIIRIDETQHWYCTNLQLDLHNYRSMQLANCKHNSLSHHPHTYHASKFHFAKSITIFTIPNISTTLEWSPKRGGGARLGRTTPGSIKYLSILWYKQPMQNTFLVYLHKTLFSRFPIELYYFRTVPNWNSEIFFFPKKLSQIHV